jgi:hypothetical protein
VKRLLDEASAALGAPPELIAVPLLIFAGAVIGHSRSIRPKRSWEEFPALFAAVVAEPGGGKTPALKVAQHPLVVLQEEAFAADRIQRAKGGDPMQSTPMSRRYFTTDATMEAIGPLAAASPGIVLMIDEILGFVKGMDAYRGGRGGDLQKWLSAWSSSAFVIDRKGAEPIWVRNPVVGVVGGIQPDMLVDFVRSDRRDGFFDRFLWSWPETTLSLWSEEDLASETVEAVVALFRRLDAVAQSGERHRVALGPAAKAVWIAWHDETHRRARKLTGLAKGVEVKLLSQCLRLILILHCLTDPDGAQAEVDEATVHDAIALVDYFRAHAQRVIAQVERQRAPGAGAMAMRVLRQLAAADGWVSMTKLHKTHGNHVPADALSRALTELHSLGMAETRAVQTKGRPSQEWRATTRTNEESFDLDAVRRSGADSFL